MKKHLILFALFVMLFASVAVLSSCNESVNEPSYADYNVKVVDELGAPVSQVMIKFKGEDGTEKTRMTDQTGIATLKSALVGKYELSLNAGLGSAILKNDKYTLEKDDTNFEIVVRNGDITEEIYGAELVDAYAYTIHDGTYDTVHTSAGEYVYFIFTTPHKGIYTFSVESDDDSAYIGYFGMPYLAYAEHIGESHDGKSFNITIQDTGTPYVIGIKTETGAKCVLKALKTADAPFDPQYASWVSVKASEKYLKPCDTTGKTLEDFDITARNLSVTLGDDGYYRTSDGKLVYIRIKSASPYLDPLSLMCGFDNDDIGATLGGYVYDDDGNFVEKRSYNEMVGQFIEYCDSTYGVVPLTDELAAGIRLHGESKGWFDASSGGYLFDGVAVNNEISWLFLCMVEK